MRVISAYRRAPTLLVPLTILLLPSVPMRADGAVGRTAGEFSVGTTGNAQYSIPVWTPPGTNGLAPSLSLNYSSRRGNGYLGNGFSISGLSVLARCNATKAQDTNGHGVNFIPADKYCLDGQRLRLVSGTYAAANSTYQTEFETFRRITLKATDANGAVWWEVRMRDGLIYEYGNTTDSRIRLTTGSGSLSATRLLWAVNRIRDRAGNYIDFSYVQDATNGGYYPQEVRWTGNTNGTAPAYKAVFTSEAAERPDVIRNFMRAPSGTSGAFHTTRRLSRIEMLYVPTSRIVRKFQFTYQAAGGTGGLSRLASVVECGLDGSDCLAPTTFSWNTPGWSIVSASGGVIVPAGVTPFVMDISGDGRDDVVWSSSATSGAGTWRYMLANASGSFNAPVNSGISNTNYAKAQIIEWNGDAKADLIVPLSGNTWWVLQANGTGFNVPFNTGVAYSFPTVFADIDGDGRDDLVRKFNGLSMRLRSGTAFGAETVAYVPPWPVSNIYAINSQRRQDFDGDGREDLVIVIDQIDAVGNHTFKTSTVFGNSTNIIAGLEYGVVTYIGSADFNGDQRSDIAWLSGGILRTSINTSSGPASAGSQNVVLTDWDGDGKDDALIPISGQWDFARSTGAGFAPLTSTNITVLASRVGDVDGDSFKDLVGVEANTIKYIRHSTDIPWQFKDLVQTVTDGFGVAATFTYGSLADPAVHTPSTGAQFPIVDVNDSSKSVVKQVAATDGTGNSSTYTLTFTYEGARYDERATRTFAKRTIVDNRLGYNLKTEETFEQSWPFTGLRKKYTLKQSSGTVIRETTNTWNALSYNPGFSGRSYPYISTTVTKEYEVGGAQNGTLLRTISSVLPGANGVGGIDATSGLIKDMTTTTVEGGSGLFTGYSKSERVYHPTFLNDLPNWCIGRPQDSELENSHTASAGGVITRSLSQAWDGPSCRITSRTVEPGNAQWQVTTALGYDAFGNVATQTVTGAGMSPRVTAINWGTSGQFPLATTNALSQTTNRTFQPETGLVKTVTDANGLTTTRAYDNFGRLTLETRPDATKTAWTYAACPTGCDARVRYTVQEQMRKVDNSALRTNTHYFDRYDRLLYSYRQLASGDSSIASVDFDARGRVTRRYVPAWSAGANGYAQIGYDSLDRVTSEGLYTAGGALNRQTTYTYSGLAVTTTDPRLYATTEMTTAWGDLARVADPAGGFTNYEHNAFGELTKITDAAANVVSSIVHNIRGMQISTADADLGAWTFVPNALGELSSRTDPRGNTTAFQYDALGRMTQRSELEGATTWTWGSSAAAKNIGRLQSASSPGYSEALVYNSLARLSTRTITTDVAYQIAFGYDAQTGLLSSLTYPVSTSGYRFKLQYEYAYGFLSKVKRFDTPFTEYWKLDTVDARANVTDESLGNGIRVITGFDPLTGLIDHRQSGPSGGTSIQNLAYEWDASGNLSWREDVRQGLREVFVNDSLDRVTSSTLNGSTNLTAGYNLIGNVTSKSDVGSGTWTYHANKKHAVTGAASNAYSYDADGNMSSRNGSSTVWTSYNYPSQINGTGASSQFSYGPGRQRFRQVAVQSGATTTTHYIGGVLEKVVNATNTQYRHHIEGPTGLVAAYVRRSSGVLEDTYYFTKDHLGSLDSVTNASGNVRVRLSYDAFGERRKEAGWSGAVPSADLTEIANTTRRGFTGHEMLDNLNLVHMNGRVYDPIIGRFLSADPVRGLPRDPQSLNRYSYVFNSPLSWTDPSGFCGATSVNNFVPALTWIPTWTTTVIDEQGVSTTTGGGWYALDYGSNQTSFMTPCPYHLSVYSLGQVGYRHAPSQGNSGEVRDGCNKPANTGKGFAERIEDNFVDTNQIPGILAPIGAGSFTNGAISQAALDTNAAAFLRWTLNMTRPFAVGAAQLTWTESAIAVAGTSAVNWAYAGLAFEIGALIGSTVSALPGPGDSESVRSYLADLLFDTFGPTLPAEWSCNTGGGW